MLRVHKLGRISYSKALPQQVGLKDIVRKTKPEDDFLILLEHTPVLTLGKSWQGGNMLLSIEKYEELGFEVHKVSRGGDITYHGPGQLVAYPVFQLSRHGKDIHKFLRNLEEVSIRVMGEYGIEGSRKDGMTGAWSPSGKVCAIGVAISGWVSYHGLAFNVDPEMSHFGLIVPCGISKYPVASLKSNLGFAPPMAEVEQKFINNFCEVFNFNDFKVYDDSETSKLSCVDEEGNLSDRRD